MTQDTPGSMTPDTPGSTPDIPQTHLMNQSDIDTDSYNNDGVLQLCHTGFVMSGSNGRDGSFAFLYDEVREFQQELEEYKSRHQGKIPPELQANNKTPSLIRLISESPQELQDYIHGLETYNSSSSSRNFRDDEERIMRKYSAYLALARCISRGGRDSDGIVTPLQELNNKTSKVNVGLRNLNVSYPGLLDEIGRYDSPWHVHRDSSNVIVLTPTPVLNEVVRIEIDIGSGILKLCASWNGRGNEVHIPLNQWEEKIHGKDLHSALVELSTEFTRDRTVSTTLSLGEYMNLSTQESGIKVRNSL